MVTVSKCQKKIILRFTLSLCYLTGLFDTIKYLQTINLPTWRLQFTAIEYNPAKVGDLMMQPTRQKKHFCIKKLVDVNYELPNTEAIPSHFRTPKFQNHKIYQFWQQPHIVSSQDTPLHPPPLLHQLSKLLTVIYKLKITKKELNAVNKNTKNNVEHSPFLILNEETAILGWDVSVMVLPQ